MLGSSAGDHAPALAPSAFTAMGVSAEPGGGSAAGRRWGIVVARFNGAVTGALFEGAVRTLLDAGAAPGDVVARSVPGALELPLAAQQLIDDDAHDVAGVVALGCVIRGETAHFDHVCRASVDGLVTVQLTRSTPVGVGVVTCDTLAQAEARSSLLDGGHNVGADAARATIELALAPR